jgi:hypothetical protein
MAKTIYDIPKYDANLKLLKKLPPGEFKDVTQHYIDSYIGQPYAKAPHLRHEMNAKLGSTLGEIFYGWFIGGKPTTWAVNMSALPAHAIPEYGLRTTARSLYRFLSDKKLRQEFNETGYMMDYPGMEVSFRGKKWQRRFLHGGMSKGEWLMRGTGWVAANEKFKAQGLKGDDLRLAAFDSVDKIFFNYGKSSPLMPLDYLQKEQRVFQRFPRKMYELMETNAREAWKGGPAERARFLKFAALWGAIAYWGGPRIYDIGPNPFVGLTFTAAASELFYRWAWKQDQTFEQAGKRFWDRVKPGAVHDIERLMGKKNKNKKK